MEQAILDAFSQATTKVINSIAQVDIAPFEHDFKKKGPLGSFINGNLGMTGHKKVSVTISFSKDAIYKLYLSVFPDEKLDITFTSLGDLVGEITNMISGHARGILSEQGIKFEASLPSVIIGDRQHIYKPMGTVSEIIPFSFNSHTMFIELLVKNKE